MVAPDGSVIGFVAPDAARATNERVVIRAPDVQRQHVQRNQFVTITDALAPETVFLGRLVGGPFFPRANDQAGDVLAEVEVQGELREGQPRDTNNRPAPAQRGRQREVG
jgi:hypothetical protein